jgi:hypothetical protein
MDENTKGAAAPQVVADERALFSDWLATMPKPVQENIKASMGRGESYTFKAFCAALQAAPVQAQEPVAWRYEWASRITCDGPQNFKLTFDVDPPPAWAVEDGQARNVVQLFASSVQPVAVPEAAQQNGGLVRAALIDLLSPEVERAANSGAVSFECQSNIATIFARGRQALAQSAFDATPAAQGDDKSLAQHMPESIETDDALWRSGCTAFRLALNEMTGRDGYVVKKTYEALRKHILDRDAIAAKAANK